MPGPVPPRRPIPHKPALPVPTAAAAQPAAEATAPAATPAAAPAPAKKPVPPRKPTAKTPAKPAPKPAAKPAPKAVKKAAPGPKPASENVVPKVKAIKSKHWADEAVELAMIVVNMKQVVPAETKRVHGLELREVPARLQVYFNEKLGIPALKVYSRAEHKDPILALFKKVPAELLPAKWCRVFEVANPDAE
jgi:hypothetical protein